MHRSLRIILLMVLCLQPCFSIPTISRGAAAASFPIDPFLNRPADTWSTPRCAALDRPPDPDAPAAPSAPYSTYLPLANSRMSTPAAVTDPKLTNDLGQTTFTLGSNDVVVTTTDDYGQPVKGMKVVVLSTPTKFLAVTEDPQGRFAPAFKEVAIRDAKTANDQLVLSSTVSILVLLDDVLAARGVVELAADIPTILRHNWVFTDYCMTASQMANTIGVGGGFLGSMLGGPLLGIGISLSDQIIHDLLTSVWCHFRWPNPAVVRVYHIPGITVSWFDILGPCPNNPQVDICFTVIQPRGQLSGQVIDARTGAGLFGVFISMPYDGLTTMTDPDGFYTISGVPTGYHLLKATKTGYVGMTDVILVQYMSWANFNLSPEGTSTSEFRFVLNWGSEPHDLDSHLWLPTSNPAHIYFRSRGTLDAFPYAMLDLDDTNGFGPETLTMYRNYGGTYLYAVHRYAGSGTLAGSGATVDIFRGSELFQRVTAPSTGTGDWWVVATVDGTTGFISVLNYIAANQPRTYPTPASEIHVPKLTAP